MFEEGKKRKEIYFELVEPKQEAGGVDGGRGKKAGERVERDTLGVGVEVGVGAGNEEGLGLKAVGSGTRSCALWWWGPGFRRSRKPEFWRGGGQIGSLLTKAKPKVGNWGHSREDEGVHQEQPSLRDFPKPTASLNHLQPQI